MPNCGGAMLQSWPIKFLKIRDSITSHLKKSEEKLKIHQIIKTIHYIMKKLIGGWFSITKSHYNREIGNSDFEKYPNILHLRTIFKT